MTREQVFAAWAPVEGIWSPWVKPVLFAHARAEPAAPRPAPTTPDVSWAPPADGETALVIDLPGSAGPWLAAGLARAGYRPVPLYNAAPGPAGELRPGLQIAVVDTWQIVHALAAAGAIVASSSLPPDAPPAFLLDARRRTGVGAPAPGRFDNRSVSFPTDFPSVNLLQNRGIRNAVLVQSTLTPPQPDLAHTLRRWQDAGIVLQQKLLDTSGPAQPLHVAPPSLYRCVWHRLLTLIRLRRSPLGGFGGMLAEPSAG